jgi:GNAT superfamily N-acetyltransferase
MDSTAGQTSDDGLADAAAYALALSMWPRAVESARGGWFRQQAGVTAFCTQTPVALFNGVTAASRSSDPALVDELLDTVSAEVALYCLQIRPGADQITDVARARGMVVDEREPLMLLEDPRRLAPAVSVDGLVVRRLRDEEVDQHLAILAEGFGAPVEVFAPWAGGDLLAVSGVSAYVASVGGRDVGTALGIVADDHVGVFNVAVTPDHRRRGYGAALSARTVLDGLAAGAHRALLMSSELGRPVYQSLGFRELEQWSYWVPAGAAEG